MDFLIMRPLPPKTGYHFFEGGVGGEGVKSFCSKASKQWGRTSLTHNCWSNGNAADVKFSVGGSNPGRLTFGGGGGGGGVKFTLTGFEPPTKEAPVSCTTIRPLLGLSQRVSPLLGAASATDKEPMFCQKHMFCIPVQDCLYLFVCFCLTDCWPGSGTGWLTVNLSSRCTAEGNRISQSA